MSKKSRYQKIRSEDGMIIESVDGESIVVKIDKKEGVWLESKLKPDFGGLGSFRITGLSAKKAASKKKSFWGKLWSKIKGLAGKVLDAVTVPVFGYSCRPDISVDLKGRGVSIGISCKEI